MRNLKFIVTLPFTLLQKAVNNYGLKNVFWVFMIPSLVLFGDHLIPAIFHALHLCWGLVEMVIENLLEEHFDLTPRQAEILTAWFSFFLIAVLKVILLYKAYRRALLIPEDIKKLSADIRRRFKEQPAITGLWMSALTLGTASATMLFLS